LRNLVRGFRRFPGSAEYWQRRYQAGGTSGSGSYGEYAAAKAAVVNDIVATYGVKSVVEFGCGDGNQLELLVLPRYLGLDVAARAIELCAERFARDRTKSFFRYDPAHFVDRAGVVRADLALSQEVIFHLIEDEVFATYMNHLFDAAERLVLICSSDEDLPLGKHERHRTFTPWVEQFRPDWQLLSRVANPHPFDPNTGAGMRSDFFLYGRRESDPS